MKFARGFAPILIILFVIFLLVCSLAISIFVFNNYFQKPKSPEGVNYVITADPKEQTNNQVSNEAINWKTYKGINLDLTIMYPKSWSIIDEHTQVGNLGQETERYIKITSQNSTKLQITDWIPEMGPFGPDDNVMSEIIDVDGYKLQLDYVQGFPKGRLIIGQILVKERQIRIYVSFDTENTRIIKEDWEIVKEIIKTIKFD